MADPAEVAGAGAGPGPGPGPGARTRGRVMTPALPAPPLPPWAAEEAFLRKLAQRGRACKAAAEIMGALQVRPPPPAPAPRPRPGPSARRDRPSPARTHTSRPACPRSPRHG